MLLKRVQFLSDYAESYMEKGEALQKKLGLWENIIVLFKKAEKRYRYFPPLEGETTTKDLIESNFAGFCRIGKAYIYVKKNSEDLVCQMAIVENDMIWDMSDWGEGYRFVTNFIAQCYFMVTKDDYIIDEDEKKIITALLGCLEPSYQEILDARNLVYWTLIDNVIEDDIVTAEEKEQMAKIRAALGLSTKNVNELHLKALKQYYKQVEDVSSFTHPDLTRLARIRKMAKTLGLNPDDVATAPKV